MTKDGSNARKQAARELAEAAQIPYTEALRRIDERAAAHALPAQSETVARRIPATSAPRITPPVAALAPDATLLGHTSPVGAVAFHPDGHILASGGDVTARLWDLATGQTVTALTQDAGVASVAFSPDGHTLAVGSGDGAVLLWNIATAEIVTLGRCADVVRSIAFSPDGHTVAAGSAYRPPSLSPRQMAFPAHTIQLWNTATGTATSLTRPADDGYGDAIAFHPNGNTLAGSGGLDGTVRLWNLADGQSTTLTGHTGGIETVAFRPDGRMLASGSVDGTLRLWDPATGQCTAALGPRGGYVVTLAFSPDGRILASGTGGVVRLWDTATGQATANLLSHAEHITSLAFSPDGHTLAGAGFDAIRLWTVPPGPRASP